MTDHVTNANKSAANDGKGPSVEKKQKGRNEMGEKKKERKRERGLLRKQSVVRKQNI